jgi:hypothetical protein
LGQFVTPDPLANTSDNSTLDPYGYAADNPVAYADPSGLVNQSNGGDGCGSMSFSDCANVEKATGMYTKIMDQLSSSRNFMDDFGDDVADIGVQALNDTKNGFLGFGNGMKDVFVNAFGAVPTGPAGGPAWTADDVPDVSVPDIPMPAQFHGPKALLQVGGAVASLLIPGPKLGKLIRVGREAGPAAAAGDGGRDLFAVRAPSAAHPPSPTVVAAMRASHDACYDCSEIADDLLNAAGGQGRVVTYTPAKGTVLRTPENGGDFIQSYVYHSVYTDGRYAYDPRFSSVPVPLGDFNRMMRGLNPGLTIR